ncbi:Pimeloyl-ACP methyl ester carboxylesterase [Mesorhizobium albiziae]|uniref:Pimeloyl-ACP methyl ester carboxylesterase n=1 Tax=Neomesorhizobium albiziae TaxID=335020 RepID=A0A1I3V7B2_9HYPH|nr:alpha/beta hydrolase [Mesorhizobium albiziae]GLS28655.1 hydrolase [Mesorhizobium albiziae]SFJ90226.1 Pimeloyl-ACP methyl ester carboxylesterase [Mesorhizobium albiziae]
MLNVHKAKHRTVEVDGVKLFYREAGRRAASGVLLLHGQPSSSYSFRDVMSPLAEVAWVVAPDLPGFGFTEASEDYEYTFEAMARTVDALTREIGLERFFLYVHDFGAPVAYYLALARPDRVLGLIIQNGNAHEEGLGPDWEPNKAYWADPTPENRARLPQWLNFEGVRHTYVGDIPDRLKPLFAPDGWHLDWERMSRPGLVEIQFRIFEDYGRYVARFPEISAYHRDHQPPSLMLWGRHDPYFEIEEVLAYARELDRLDMHIYDAAHLLLETHHQECAALMCEFIQDARSS